MGFKSIFQKEMEDYLKLRKQATCTATYKSTQYTLQSFDEYLAMYHDGSKSVSMENVYGWIRTLYSSSYADKLLEKSVNFGSSWNTSALLVFSYLCRIVQNSGMITSRIFSRILKSLKYSMPLIPFF